MGLIVLFILYNILPINSLAIPANGVSDKLKKKGQTLYSNKAINQVEPNKRKKGIIVEM